MWSWIWGDFWASDILSPPAIHFRPSVEWLPILRRSWHFCAQGWCSIPADRKFGQGPRQDSVQTTSAQSHPGRFTRRSTLIWYAKYLPTFVSAIPLCYWINVWFIPTLMSGKHFYSLVLPPYICFYLHRSQCGPEPVKGQRRTDTIDFFVRIHRTLIHAFILIYVYHASYIFIYSSFVLLRCVLALFQAHTTCMLFVGSPTDRTCSFCLFF